MLTTKAENLTERESEQRASFFRQSGFLMVANVAGGVFMWAVHLLSKAIPEAEYGAFGVLLGVVILLPTVPIQMVVAQQTAKALALEQRAELSGILRWFFWVIFFSWAIFTLAVIAFKNWIVTRWQLPNATGLWFLVPIVLFQLLLPLLWGALQGSQNFKWLGWSMISNGIGRLATAAVAVLIFHFYATGMISGVLLGLMVAAAFAGWHARSLLLVPPLKVAHGSVIRQISPLILAFLGFQFLFTADTLFVKAYFSPEATAFYVSAGTLSRALMWLVGPLAMVMFPRAVHGAVKSEKSNLMRQVFWATGALAFLGAVGLSVLAPWVVKFVFKPSYVEVATSILPWYAGAMIPLAMANVLLNDILARSSSKAPVAICVFLLAIVYGVALSQFHSSLKVVLQVLLVCNLVFLAICSWFAMRSDQRAVEV